MRELTLNEIEIVNGGSWQWRVVMCAFDLVSIFNDLTGSSGSSATASGGGTTVSVDCSGGGANGTVNSAGDATISC